MKQPETEAGDEESEVITVSKIHLHPSSHSNSHKSITNRKIDKRIDMLLQGVSIHTVPPSISTSRLRPRRPVDQVVKEIMQLIMIILIPGPFLGLWRGVCIAVL